MIMWCPATRKTDNSEQGRTWTSNISGAIFFVKWLNNTKFNKKPNITTSLQITPRLLLPNNNNRNRTTFVEDFQNSSTKPHKKPAKDFQKLYFKVDDFVILPITTSFVYGHNQKKFLHPNSIIQQTKY